MIVANTMPLTIAAGVRAIAGRIRDPEVERRLSFFDAYEGRGMAEACAPYFTPTQRSSVPMMTQRIVKKLIDARFCAYKTPPVRTADERYLELAGDLDADMVALERMTGLQGTMALLRFYDAERKVLDSRMLPVFEPLFLPGEVEPFGVAYPLHDPGQQDASKREWAVWTDADYFIVSGGAVLPGLDADGNERADLAHGLDRLPVLFAHTGPAIPPHWFRAGAVDMVNAQLLFNTYGTHHALGVLWQTHGQPVATGVDPRSEVMLGIDKIVKLEQGGSFRFETPNAKLADIMDAQRWVVDSAAYANHLQVKWASGGGATSGEHLRMMEVDLTEAVLSDFNLWRAFEADRFKLDRVLLASVGITIPDGYSVDFSEPHIPDSPAEKRERWDWELSHGLTTLRQVKHEMNPDMDEAALDKWEEEMAALKPGTPGDDTGGSAFARALARPVNA